MIETITPVVHGGRRGGYVWSVILHVFGTTVAAAFLGLVLGGLGKLAREVIDARVLVGAVALVALAYFVREAFRVPVPIPDRHRQVPEWWRTFFSPPVTALFYGLGLGVGFLTFLSFGTFVAVTVGAFAMGDPLKGALVTAPFGLARGLSVVLSSRAASSMEIDGVLEKLEKLAATSTPRLVNAAALAGVLVATVLAL